MNTHWWDISSKHKRCVNCGLRLILMTYTSSNEQKGEIFEIWVRMEAVEDRLSGGFDESPVYGTCDEEKARSIISG
jgi:hypothetical protein